MVSRVSGADGDRTVRTEPDQVIVEEPMSIRLDDTLVSTTMRTPGHDFELAAGFCFTEGMLGGHPITDVRYCADDRDAGNFNIITVETNGRAPAPTPRLGTTSSSCGWCGSEQLDEMYARLAPLAATPDIDIDMLAGIPDAVRASQKLFDVTGSVHCAGVFDRRGEVGLVREDVGRHNAVDKVIGNFVLAGRLPTVDDGIFVSGRASIEMVQKAWAAGFGTLLAVSAPTALAVDAARRAGMVLAGFVRDDRFNLYSPERC